MKELFAFLVFTVAVFAEKNKFFYSKNESKIFTDALNACIKEQNRGEIVIRDDETLPSDSCLQHDPNFVLCVCRKVGLVKEDGTYNSKLVLSWMEASDSKTLPEARAFMEMKMRDCPPKAGNDPCKLVACVYDLQESLCGKPMGNEEKCV